MSARTSPSRGCSNRARWGGRLAREGQRRRVRPERRSGAAQTSVRAERLSASSRCAANDGPELPRGRSRAAQCDRRSAFISIAASSAASPSCGRCGAARAEVSEGPACPKQPGRARGRVGSDSARRGEGAMRRRCRPPPLALFSHNTQLDHVQHPQDVQGLDPQGEARRAGHGQGARSLSHPHLPRSLPCPRRPRTSLAGHHEPTAAS